MTTSQMAFYQTKMAITPKFFTQKVKFTTAGITNKSAATTKFAWLTSNVSISQRIATSHGSHTVYQSHS